MATTATQSSQVTQSPPRPDYSKATDGTRVVADDPYLEPLVGHIRRRYWNYTQKKKAIEEAEGSLLEFSRGYKKFGFNRIEDTTQFGSKGILYREWAPAAKDMHLFGDFNGWNRHSHGMSRDQYGVWSIFLPDQADGRPAIQHATKVKISLVTPNNETVERIPAWLKVVWQEHRNPAFDGVYWDPPRKHEWKFSPPPIPAAGLRIYECHVGMSSPEPKISTYIEFKDNVLPWIKDVGYNAVQIMGIMEHAYYASFGYQVTNFFAISSRFGTPEELKELVDRAHELGLLVFLDLVHSHASKNTADGINQFDGTDHMYFHEGGRGYHPIWDSRLFNYGHWEVLRFLMSNAHWFIEEYHFDGFRFDGVTSMLYHHHGVAHGFTRGYDEYFDPIFVDEEAVCYLTLVNDMLHSLPHRPKQSPVICIAEDVSGHATLCRPVQEGGVGFDYRLAMGIPDKWIEMLRDTKDEDWKMGEITWTLSNRRWKEPTIAYCESHDQALVGDKTIAFWLMDKDMYTDMSVLGPITPSISRGMALHKMIRLITFGLGGEGYLTFMGNEFGHPEWIDFPREGNNNSYHYARRRFDLAKDPLLRYQHLLNFDRAMQHLEEKYPWLWAPSYVSLKHEVDKVITFERGGLFWVFNFHPTQSFTDYKLGIEYPGKYQIVLDSDAKEFGGHERITKHTDYFTFPEPWNNRAHSILLYLPSRCALVFAKAD